MTPTALAEVASPSLRPQPFPDVEQRHDRLRQKYVALGLVLSSGLLLYLCFFPVACGWLAWVALVPLLLLARSQVRPIILYAMTALAGLVFYVPGLQWMRVADPAMYFAWGFLAIYCALYFPAALFFIRYLDRRTRLPMTITVPVVWTALEYLRSQFGTGFSWYLLGHSQHDYLAVIQIADLGGAYGVSFLVATVNGLLADALLLNPTLRHLVAPSAPARYGRVNILIQAAVVGAVLLGVCGYGWYRLSQHEFSRGPRIALLQGNLDQRIRNDSHQAKTVGLHFAALCDRAAGDTTSLQRWAIGGGVAWVDGWFQWRKSPPSVDLAVWPETSYPMTWYEDRPGVPASRCDDEAYEMGKHWNAPMLLGLKSSIPEQGDHAPARMPDHRAEYNSALLVTNGKAVGRYDKIHLVPLGEYVPFRETFPFLKKLAPYDFDYSVDSGREHPRLPLETRAQGKSYTFGVVICYEDTDPDVARPYAGGDDQPPADFLLNISNDGWFNGTSEHEQHLAIARFRAIECRRSLGRAVNMGISAIIDPNGRVLAPREYARISTLPNEDNPEAPIHLWQIDQDDWTQTLPPSRWGEFKKVQGVLFATLPIDNRTSFYARAGDWLPWSCWCALAVGLFAATTRRVRAV